MRFSRRPALILPRRSSTSKPRPHFFFFFPLPPDPLVIEPSPPVIGTLAGTVVGDFTFSPDFADAADFVVEGGTPDFADAAGFAPAAVFPRRKQRPQQPQQHANFNTKETMPSTKETSLQRVLRTRLGGCTI